MAQQTTLTYLDGYCERAGDPALWAEPLNAVTNLFFILAAFLAARALMRVEGPGRRIDLWLLVAALFAIGIGSGIWHLHPTGATVLMDVIPITLFINIYLVASMRRALALSWRKTVAWWALYFGAGLVAQILLPPDTLNGTIMYIPTYLTLVVLTYAVSRRDKALGRVFAIATAVWTLSLIARTLDRDLCPEFHFGTHFLWHTLNAWVLWRLLMALIGQIKQKIH